MNRVTIIEAPSNLGLKEPAPGREPGVRRLPDWLRTYGLHTKIKAAEVLRVEPPPYGTDLDAISGVRNAEGIVSFSRELSKSVSSVVEAKDFALVLGGDCSILIGCALGLRTLGRYGLFFIDGHTDFVLADMSVTKAAAGMDLAIVTGHGHGRLTDMDRLRPYIREYDTLAFGNRYMSPDYVGVIERSSIHYVDLPSARKQGIGSVVAEFLNRMAGLDGFWIHLDVDVLEDREMPCVDSRQAGGLTYTELRQLLRLLLESPLASGMDITILDPDLDPEGMYTARFVQKVGDILCPVSR